MNLHMIRFDGANCILYFTSLKTLLQGFILNDSSHIGICRRPCASSATWSTYIVQDGWTSERMQLCLRPISRSLIVLTNRIYSHFSTQ